MEDYNLDRFRITFPYYDWYGKNPNVAAVIVIGIEPKWTKRIVDALQNWKPVEGFSIEGVGDIDTIAKFQKKPKSFQCGLQKTKRRMPSGDLWISVKCMNRIQLQDLRQTQLLEI